MFDAILDRTIVELEPGRAIEIPPDEMHQDILLPLLPAMLTDRAIRQSWIGQTASGFCSRLREHLQSGTAAPPRWSADDFEIHVTSSYLAGPDAKALADTLLSEPSIRELTADLMNRLLDLVWPGLASLSMPAIPPSEPAGESAIQLPVAVKSESVRQDTEVVGTVIPVAPSHHRSSSAPVPAPPTHHVAPWRLLRTCGWKTRLNPLAGPQAKAAWEAANPLACNPLRPSSDSRHGWKIAGAR